MLENVEHVPGVSGIGSFVDLVRPTAHNGRVVILLNLEQWSFVTAYALVQFPGLPS